MKTALLLALLNLAIASAHGQAEVVEDTTRLARRFDGLRVEGMLGVAVNARTMALTLGGPSLRVIVNKDLAIGVGGFPSLFMSRDRVEPKLGLSPRIDYKRFVLIAPSYHFTSPRRKWVNTVGLCYKFQR